MTCGKFMFRTYKQAAQVANRQNRERRYHSKTTHRVHVYHCPLCGSHHVTGFNN